MEDTAPGTMLLLILIQGNRQRPFADLLLPPLLSGSGDFRRLREEKKTASRSSSQSVTEVEKKVEIFRLLLRDPFSFHFLTRLNDP